MVVLYRGKTETWVTQITAALSPEWGVNGYWFCYLRFWPVLLCLSSSQSRTPSVLPTTHQVPPGTPGCELQLRTILYHCRPVPDAWCHLQLGKEETELFLEEKKNFIVTRELHIHLRLSNSHLSYNKATETLPNIHFKTKLKVIFQILKWKLMFGKKKKRG